MPEHPTVISSENVVDENVNVNAMGSIHKLQPVNKLVQESKDHAAKMSMNFSVMFHCRNPVRQCRKHHVDRTSSLSKTLS